MKNKEEQKLWIIAVGLTVLSITLIASQFIFSSDIRYDKQTAEDLRIIEQELSNENEPIQSIDELTLSESIKERAEERDYSVKFVRNQTDGSVVYEICAHFKTDTSSESDSRYYHDYSDHSAGKDCFEREVYSNSPDAPLNR